MNALRRLWSFLSGPPCPGCGRRDPHGRMLGAWWHEDWCPELRPTYQEGADDE